MVGELLADLERFRPGLPQDAPPQAVLAALSARARLRLEELHREYRVDDSPSDPDTAAQLQLYHREVEQILLPRYAVLAHRQNALEQGRGTAWRGSDLYNRLTYAVLFFAIGLFVVWAPFIPLWDKWIPFAFALLAPLCTPWLPDLYRLMLRSRHQLELELLHQDLDRVGRSLPLAPISLPAPAGRAAAPLAARSASHGPPSEANRKPPPES